MSSEEDLVAQFIPIIVASVLYAAIVYVIARKRGVNPWFWTICTLIPVVGLLVAAVFYLLSFLSVLDRLNRLEAGASPKTIT